jgi:hypothetical protein
MNKQDAGSEEPVVYALRLHERALRDINAAYVRTVTILHIRHASARPITRTQAREIEAEE